jgi:hypothetical protein
LTYIFVDDAHEAAVETNVQVCDINASLIPHLPHDVADSGKHLVCTLLGGRAVYQRVRGTKVGFESAAEVIVKLFL